MNGLPSQLMIDLQRVFACIQVHQSSEDPKVKLDVNYMAAVGACQDFSSKVCLGMSSSGEWRHTLPSLLLGGRLGDCQLSSVVSIRGFLSSHYE
jgi:hypothetical protein